MPPCLFDEVFNDKAKAGADTDEAAAGASSTNASPQASSSPTITTDRISSTNWVLYQCCCACSTKYLKTMSNTAALVGYSFDRRGTIGHGVGGRGIYWGRSMGRAGASSKTCVSPKKSSSTSNTDGPSSTTLLLRWCRSSQYVRTRSGTIASVGYSNDLRETVVGICGRGRCRRRPIGRGRRRIARPPLLVPPKIERMVPP